MTEEFGSRVESGSVELEAEDRPNGFAGLLERKFEEHNGVIRAIH